MSEFTAELIPDTSKEREQHERLRALRERLLNDVEEGVTILEDAMHSVRVDTDDKAQIVGTLADILWNVSNLPDWY